MFAISSTAIDIDALKKSLQDDRAGALATFEGWVRNHNDGMPVTQLEYEAYEALCASEAEKILTEARQQFGILNACCVHRAGVLKVGEMAVFVGVTSVHRAAAFDACRYIIDKIKSRLPIWKKESYEGGDSGWVNCQSGCGKTHAESHTQAQSHMDASAGSRAQAQSETHARSHAQTDSHTHSHCESHSHSSFESHSDSQSKSDSQSQSQSHSHSHSHSASEIRTDRDSVLAKKK